jgi:hypothetical protein
MTALSIRIHGIVPISVCSVQRVPLRDWGLLKERMRDLGGVIMSGMEDQFACLFVFLIDIECQEYKVGIVSMLKLELQGNSKYGGKSQPTIFAHRHSSALKRSIL